MRTLVYVQDATRRHDLNRFDRRPDTRGGFLLLLPIRCHHSETASPNSGNQRSAQNDALSVNCALRIAR